LNRVACVAAQITFDELKDRMAQRLHSMGIVITSIEEDEYCLIPMGGVLPTFPQRTLGVGGTAGMVHPSTGYVDAPHVLAGDRYQTLCTHHRS
jgi:lycopene beta-cyclase